MSPASQTPDKSAPSAAQRPDAAVADEGARRDLDDKLQRGIDDLDAGRSHSAEDVWAFLQTRLGSAVDAAE